MANDVEEVRPSQESVFSTPTFFVDGNLGIATGGGVARITLAAYKLNVDPSATQPLLHPEVTIAVSEPALLAFAHEVIERAAHLGIAVDPSA